MFLDFVLNGSDEEMNVKLLALCLTIYTLASFFFFGLHLLVYYKGYISGTQMEELCSARMGGMEHPCFLWAHHLPAPQYGHQPEIPPNPVI
jgi:hypothetical protein